VSDVRLDRLRKGLPGASLALAAGTLLLGLVVLFGWHTGNRTLVQVLPQFVPMQYNTALGFVFCGAALLGLALGRPRVGVAAAGIASDKLSLVFEEFAQAEDDGHAVVTARGGEEGLRGLPGGRGGERE
jgi:hypothetical protein